MQTLSEYEITEVIASSARSRVERAIRRRDGQRVVIKSPGPDRPLQITQRQLEFEYRILRKLDVPGVVQAIDLDMTAGAPRLILEDFGGRNLPEGPAGADLDFILEVAIQVARTLGRVHARSVVHKDIKPRNLLFNPDTLEVKVIDFHICSELSRERQDAGATREQLGSLAYMSPEQTGRMNRELDYRSDYYSLGATLFELLTGRLPFEASDAMGWVHCHISKRAPQACRVNPEVPEALSELVNKLLAKDPDARYQSSYGLVRDLENCQAQWRASRQIRPLPLGAHDVSERFQLSQKLFGRERELAKMDEVFREASEGPARLLLVGGYSGIGKSSLVNELQKSIIGRHGYFASGKFEQLDRNVPYGGIVQALRRLVAQLLGETDARLAEWRRALLVALGTNGRVMVDLVPELERIIGPQPAVAELRPAEAQHRFKRVLGALVQVFARAEHPLVLFFDDLQWMDASTPGVVHDLLLDSSHLLVIGAYRDNELRDGHSLSLFIKELREQRPDAVRELSLHPLDEAAINALIAETLRASPADTAPLARVIFDKTEGNPFFTNELLASLHRDGAFVFDAAEGRWRWDAEEVRRAAVSESVAELMVERLRRLPPQARSVLEVGACVGSEFDLETLARVRDEAPDAVARALWEAIAQRIVVPLDSSYRFASTGGSEGVRGPGVRYQFQHDRVLHAAYSLLGPAERAAVHLRIGRLLQGESATVRDERLFQLVNHLNLAAHLMTDPAERAGLSDLNFAAGKRAKHAAAYPVAARYFEACADLLSTDRRAREPDLCFERLFERAECVFLAGDGERAAGLCQELHQLAPSRLAKGAVYSLETRIFEYQGRLRDAVGVVRAGLRLFGVDLPEDPRDIEAKIGEGIGKMQAHLAKRPIEDLLNLPQMVDRERVMTMKLLFQVIPSAIQTQPPLFILAELWMFDLAVTHGTTDVSCKNFVDCGIIQGGILGDYAGAYRLGQVAFKLLERYAPTPLESSVHFVFGAYVSHWRAHHREAFRSFAIAQRVGLDVGDLEHVAYALVFRARHMIYVGRNLAECDAETRAATAYLERARAVVQLPCMLTPTRAIARLLGTDGDRGAADRADDEAKARLLETHNGPFLYGFGVTQAVVSVILGDVAAARRWFAFTEPFVPAALGVGMVPDHHLFEALSTLQVWPELSEADREPARARLRDVREKLRVWAELCPENFAHKHHLLCAEMGRVEGEPLEQVIRSYEEAAASTGDGFVHIAALAHELQARCWRERGHQQMAAMLLREAHRLYARWGATAKLRALEQIHPDVLSPADRPEDHAAKTSALTTGATASTLDLDSILKATRAISGEVKVDRLFSTLMATLIENAGAEHGCLVLKNDGDQRLYVEAAAGVDAGPAPVRRSVPLESAARVCPEIVRYVVRTREALVLDDAAQRGAFQADAYIRQHSVRSVLCMPVVHQGHLVAVLYMENNATACAFTNDRLSALRIIAGQAAISISNALLYDNLEHKVEERTIELSEKRREIAVMLDGMAQGVCTIDADLVIMPQYSRHLEAILGTSNLAGQPCIAMLFRGARLGADAVSAMEAALRFSFGAPCAIAEANMAHLVRQFEREDADGRSRHFEVDWSLIADDDGRVGKVLVVLRDVTLIKELQATAQRKSREADIVGQILEAGLDAFRSFSATTTRLLDEDHALLERLDVISGDDIRKLFRDVHSIKGNARLLGLTHLVDVVHEAEDAYDRLRSGAAAPDRTKLVGELRRVRAALADYDKIFNGKLGAAWRTADGRLEDTLQQIERTLGDAAADSDPRATLERIRGSLRRLRAVPLADVIKETSRIIPSLARELDKSVPEVEFDPGAAVLSPEWAGVMRDVFVQSFRNSLVHGIESCQERESAGKPTRGRIRLRAEPIDAGMRVSLSDDGRGLALDALREGLAGGAERDEQVVDAVFASGMTTSKNVSRTAGRGVGMDIVRSSVRQRGGDVRIVFTGKSKDGFRPFELVVTLPPDAVLSS
ncbi:MAG TPA: AAA family ATPase [Polyangiaceae bacterium]|nr:AAA family ATPase [Polyangiaceae bacterium]